MLKRDSDPLPVLVVLIPSVADLRRFDPEVIPPLDRRLDELGADSGLEILDLLHVFAAQPGDPRRFFNHCDGHWTPSGHALAAKTIAADSFYTPIRRAHARAW